MFFFDGLSDQSMGQIASRYPWWSHPNVRAFWKPSNTETCHAQFGRCHDELAGSWLTWSTNHPLAQKCFAFALLSQTVALIGFRFSLGRKSCGLHKELDLPWLACGTLTRLANGTGFGSCSRPLHGLAEQTSARATLSSLRPFSLWGV